jgi:hypothetical protein
MTSGYRRDRVPKIVTGALLGLVLSLSRSATAQSTFATLTGSVTDPSGAVVPRAKVTIQNQRTQVGRSVISGEDGNYLAANLDAGLYSLTVEAEGFNKLVRDNIELLARQIVRVDARLEVAAEAQQVEVTASVGVITTESPDHCRLQIGSRHQRTGP